MEVTSLLISDWLRSGMCRALKKHVNFPYRGRVQNSLGKFLGRMAPSTSVKQGASVSVT